MKKIFLPFHILIFSILPGAIAASTDNNLQIPSWSLVKKVCLQVPDAHKETVPKLAILRSEEQHYLPEKVSLDDHPDYFDLELHYCTITQSEIPDFYDRFMMVELEKRYRVNLQILLNGEGSVDISKQECLPELRTWTFGNQETIQSCSTKECADRAEFLERTIQNLRDCFPAVIKKELRGEYSSACAAYPYAMTYEKEPSAGSIHLSIFKYTPPSSQSLGRLPQEWDRYFKKEKISRLTSATSCSSNTELRSHKNRRKAHVADDQTLKDAQNQLENSRTSLREVKEQLKGAKKKLKSTQRELAACKLRCRNQRKMMVGIVAGATVTIGSFLAYTYWWKPSGQPCTQSAAK